MTVDSELSVEEPVAQDSNELAPFIVIRRSTFNYIAVAAVCLILGIVIGAFSAFKVERENRSWLNEALSTAMNEALIDQADTFAGLVGTGAVGPSLDNPNSRFEVEPASDFYAGGADAPVELVEFGDYNCTYCRRFHAETLGQITSTFGDNVRYVFRDFPILGDSSVLASLASRCAGEQDRAVYWDYHDLLFNNPGSFVGNEAAFGNFAQQLGLDTEAFDTCMEERRYLPAIQQDYNDARSYGITGTPAFFVNGRPIVGAQPFDEFARVILEELETAGVDTEQFDLPSLLPEMSTAS